MTKIFELHVKTAQLVHIFVFLLHQVFFLLIFSAILAAISTRGETLHSQKCHIPHSTDMDFTGLMQVRHLIQVASTLHGDFTSVKIRLDATGYLVVAMDEKTRQSTCIKACWHLEADLWSSDRILISTKARSLQQTCCNLRVSGCVVFQLGATNIWTIYNRPKLDL